MIGDRGASEVNAVMAWRAENDRNAGGAGLTHSVRSAMCQNELKKLFTQIAECILGQIHRPYPCYTSQVLAGPGDMSLPGSRFAAFYGSFDWHSCVHSHWTLVRMLAEDALAGCGDLAEQVEAALDETFDADRIAREAQAWEDMPAHVELPYGLTWLLSLDAELAREPIEAAHPEWRRALEPLVQMASGRLRAWVDGLYLPIRSGIHSDTAWSLAALWDWAVAVGDNDMLGKIRESSLLLYAHDIDAPRAYEPGADAFSSPILNEAALMARVMTQPYGGPGDLKVFRAWLAEFLPSLYSCPMGNFACHGHLLPDPFDAWNGKDYHGVHQVALPFSRCLAARDVAAILGEKGVRRHIDAEALRWYGQGVKGLTFDGYLADHWVGTFALAAAAPAESFNRLAMLDLVVFHREDR